MIWKHELFVTVEVSSSVLSVLLFTYGSVVGDVGIDSEAIILIDVVEGTFTQYSESWSSIKVAL